MRGYVRYQSGISRYMEVGEVVGTAADLQRLKYPPSVGPHVHVQIFDKDERRIDPKPFFFKD